MKKNGKLRHINNAQYYGILTMHNNAHINLISTCLIQKMKKMCM